MSVQLGYHLDRVRALSRHAGAAVESLSSVYCSDPAAGSALRALRLARQNLEDHWMPLLREIESSEAMITWHSTPLAFRNPDGTRASYWAALDDAATRHSPEDDRISARFLAMTNDELASTFEWMGIDVENARMHDERYRTSDLWHEFSLASDVVAGRIATDESFADYFIEFPRNLPTFALAASKAGYNDQFVGNYVARLLALNSSANPWDTGLNDDRDVFVIEAGLKQLATNPSAALDLLGDSEALLGLAEWDRLDQTIVSKFVFAGLHTAVFDDVSRLFDGYGVLRDLTVHANGPLEEGMTAGMAQGVANSMIGYVDTLSQNLIEKDNVVIDVGAHDKIKIGHYNDLVDLFGSIMRDPVALGTLGTTIGAHFDYLVATEAAIGPYNDAVNFVQLLSESGISESEEMIIYAAAEEARRRQYGKFVGFFAVPAFKQLGPVGAIVGNELLDAAVDRYAHVDPDRIGDLNIESYTSKIIDVAFIRLVTNSHQARIEQHLESVTDAEWQEMSDLLQVIDDLADDPIKRDDAIEDLRKGVRNVPKLRTYVTEQRTFAGIDSLTDSTKPGAD